MSAALLWAGAAVGMMRIEVYQATVPQSERSEAGQGASFQAALRVVLVRATGRRAADQEAVFAPLLGNARRYVQQYRAAADNQLWVAFDGAALERWLVQNGQPVWGRDRPSTFVWLSIQASATSPVTVLSAEDTSDLKRAVDAAAAERGIPLIWPAAEVAAAGGNPADIGHRSGAEGLLVGHAVGTADTAVARWTLQFGEHGADASGVAEGVNRAADLYAGIYATSGSLAPLDIEVGGVTDLRDYARVQACLESFGFVSHVDVESLSGDSIRFRLTTRGGSEALQHSIALDGRLEALPTGDGGIPRFALRR